MHYQNNSPDSCDSSATDCSDSYPSCSTVCIQIPPETNQKQERTFLSHNM